MLEHAKTIDKTNANEGGSGDEPYLRMNENAPVETTVSPLLK